MQMRRFYGIDTWRATLLLVGVMVHAAPHYANDDSFSLFNWLTFISHAFRMEAFFAVAGFLAAIALEKDCSAFLLGRMRQLIIPLFATLIFVMPWYGLLDAASSHPPEGLYHLWFIVSLVVANWCAFTLEKAEVVDIILEVLGRRSSSFLIIMAIASASLTGLAVSALERLLIAHNMLASGINLPATLLRTPYFCIFYFIGFYFARVPSARASLMTKNLWLLGFVALGALTIWLYFGAGTLIGMHRSLGWKILEVIAIASSATCMAIVVIGTGITSRKPGRLVMRISAASYTIYLFHFPIVVALVPLFSIEGIGKLEQFILVSTLTICICFLFHEYVIKRSAVLRLIFNGRGGFRDTWIMTRAIPRLREYINDRKGITVRVE